MFYLLRNSRRGFFERALDADPNDANNLGNYPNFLSNIHKKYDEAETFYKRALDADPNHAHTLGNYAIFVKERGRESEAKEFEERAHSLRRRTTNRVTTKAILWVIICLPLHFRIHAQDFVTVVEDSIASKAVDAKMKFTAVLPRQYNHSQERYTTIYLLHGFGGTHTDWVKYSGLVKYLNDYSYLVICPDGKNGWYTNSIDRKRNYEDYILADLIPFVEKKYRALGTRHGRIIAGLSMGGYGALKFAMKYPARFIFAASFSGALYVPAGSRPDNKDISETLEAAFGKEKSWQWSQNDPFTLLDSIKTVSALPYLYISTGKDDALARIVENNRKLVEKLQQRGVLYEYHETSGGHSWQYWDKELRNFLRRVGAFDPLNP